MLVANGLDPLLFARYNSEWSECELSPAPSYPSNFAVMNYGNLRVVTFIPQRIQ